MWAFSTFIKKDFIYTYACMVTLLLRKQFFVTLSRKCSRNFKSSHLRRTEIFLKKSQRLDVIRCLFIWPTNGHRLMTQRRFHHSHASHPPPTFYQTFPSILNGFDSFATRRQPEHCKKRKYHKNEYYFDPSDADLRNWMTISNLSIWLNQINTFSLTKGLNSPESGSGCELHNCNQKEAI